MAGFGPIQAKLQMGKQGDRYEREADQMASIVTSGQRAEKPASQAAPGIQQKSLAESVTPMGNGGPAKENEMPVQGKEAAAGAVPAGFSAKLSASRGGGKSMPARVQSKMETGFGTSFGNVRIHTDAQAANMAGSIGAKAFTNGNNIYFNKGQFNPETNEGQHLLAHELTHTLQQQGGSGQAIQRTVADCDTSMTDSGNTATAKAQSMLSGAISQLQRERGHINQFAEVYGPERHMPTWMRRRLAVMSRHFSLADYLAEAGINTQREDGLLYRHTRDVNFLYDILLHKLQGIRIPLPFNCDDACESDEGLKGGYAIPGSGSFTICTNAWPEQTDRGKACIVLHECVHATDSVNAGDSYIKDEGSGYPPNWPGSLTNADSLANFVSEVSEGDVCGVIEAEGVEVNQPLSEEQMRAIEQDMRQEDRNSR